MKALVLLSLALTSCAYPATKEAQTSAPKNPKPAIRAHVVPGTTYGNPVLQGETIEAAKDIFAAKTTMPDCSTAQMKVSDTWPLGNPTLSEHSDAFLLWKELWTFEACGSSVDAEIVYMLHRKSGIIDVKVSPVRDGQGVELGVVSWIEK